MKRASNYNTSTFAWATKYRQIIYSPGKLNNDLISPIGIDQKLLELLKD